MLHRWIPLLLALCLVGCGIPETSSGTDATNEPSGSVTETGAQEGTDMKYQRELIPDSRFENGFTVRSQKDHENGDAIRDLGTFPTGCDGSEWLIAQWDSGPCLWQDRVDSAADVLTDGVSKWVTLGKEGEVSLRLDSSTYYATKPNGAAIAGDYWPHLLLECPSFHYDALPDAEKAYYSCGADRLMLSLDLSFDRYARTENPDDWVEADQFLLYFYVRSKTGNDFVWFGVQLFDSRSSYGDAYCALDGGKADASGSLIYSVGLSDVKNASDGTFWKEDVPNASGNTVHIKMNLTKKLKNMLVQGISMGYFSDSVRTLDDLYIDGMNIGFETIGTFDTEVTIHRISLLSEIDPAE